MSVHGKLQAARCILQTKQLKKTGHNKFAGYFYFELGDFLPEVNEIFNTLGLCSLVSYGTDLATLTITDIETGKEIAITSPMAEANLKGCHPIQNLGAVETYTRRYLYVTALEIVEHDAIDAAEPADGKKKHTGESSKTVPTSALDDLEAKAPGSREFLQNTAMDVIAAFDDSNDSGFDAYVAAKSGMDADEQAAFWGFFDSKKRRIIKDIGEARKSQNA